MPSLTSVVDTVSDWAARADKTGADMTEGPDACRPTRRERGVVFAVALLAYLAIAWWAVERHNLVLGDAISRLANATYALDSRFPHASAIGFVWGPIPTLVNVAALATHVVSHRSWFAPSIGSAIFMAAAATAVHDLAGRWGLSRRWRIAITLAFAANPLIVFYAANGMSEAYFLLFLVLAADRLARWLEHDRTADLAGCGLWLGVGYLVRYEALAAAGACAAVVVLVAAWHELAGRRRRVPLRVTVRAIASHAGMDLTVLLMPVITAFAGFAAISWVLTGQAFAQFSSSYGNSSVLQTTGPGSTGIHALGFIFGELAGAAPLAVPLLVAALLWGRRRARLRAVSLATVFGAVLFLSAALQVSGKTLPFLRFWITGIPLEVLALALLVASRPARPPRRSVLRLGMVAACVAGFAVTAIAMTSTTFGVQEHQIASALDPQRNRYDERQTLAQFDTERQIAAYLDQLQLPPGSVLVDVLDGFPVVAASRNPKQFIIPSDFDFDAALNDPTSYGVRYLLTIPATGRGVTDALNRHFPGVYDAGTPGARLVLQADSDDASPDWRLYQLLTTTS